MLRAWLLASLCCAAASPSLVEMRAFLQDQLKAMWDDVVKQDMEYFDGVYEGDVRQRLSEVEHLIVRLRKNSTRRLPPFAREYQ